MGALSYWLPCPLAVLKLSAVFVQFAEDPAKKTHHTVTCATLSRAYTLLPPAFTKALDDVTQRTALWLGSCGHSQLLLGDSVDMAFRPSRRLRRGHRLSHRCRCTEHAQPRPQPAVKALLVDA